MATGLAAALLMAGGAVGGGGEAQALRLGKNDAAKKVAYSKCVRNNAWSAPVKTGVAYPGTPQYTGKADVCFYKYRLDVVDKAGDYYVGAVTVGVSVSTTSNYGQVGTWSISISSTLSGINGVWGSTPTSYKPTGSFTLSPSVGFGPFSVSTDITWTAAETILRSKDTASGAAWKIDHIYNIKSVEVMHEQKVKEKAVPTYTASVSYGNYYYTWTLVKKGQCTAKQCIASTYKATLRSSQPVAITIKG
jgi:hypothetical protein